MLLTIVKLEKYFISNLMKPFSIIGRRENITISELGLHNIVAKIDTGAYTTALHCSQIIERDVDGVKKLFFTVLDPSHSDYNSHEYCFANYWKKTIKNSFGEKEERYIISAIVSIGKRNIRSRISLTDRGTMRYPVLIGRRLLKNKFLVDVSKVFTIKN